MDEELSGLKGNDTAKRDLRGVWSLGLIEISQSVLSLSIASGFLFVPLLMGGEQKSLFWDSGWKKRLLGVSGFPPNWGSPFPLHQAFAA